MQDVCKQFRAGAPIPATASVLPGPLEPQLRQVAEAFVELQDARHEADYDLTTSFNRVDVLQKIDVVEQAFLAWQGIRSHPNASVFLAALLLQQHWRQ